MRGRHIQILWAAVLLMPMAAIAPPRAAADVVRVGNEASRSSIARHIEFLDEDDEKWTLEDALARTDDFTPVAGDTVNFGLRRQACWFRVTIANDRPARTTYYLEIENARVKQADCYILDFSGSDAHQQAGTTIPFGERTLPYRKPVFRIPLDAGQEAALYLRVYHRGSYRFNVILWEYAAFVSNHSLQSIQFGMFYGSLLIMFAFNMILAALFRDRSFLLLAIVIISVALYMAIYQRLDVEFLWPNATNISGSRLTIPIAIGLSAAFFFSRDFLRLSKHAPRCDILFRVYGVLCLLLCVDTIAEGMWIDWTVQTIGGTAPIVLMAGAALRARQGSRYAWGYLVTWGMMFSSMVAFALLGAGFLPQIFWFEHGPKMAFPIALSLNSIGLWLRFRDLQDRHAADLEIQVQERTRELSEALENVKTLSGLIPICSACKSVRNDKGFWIRVETYIKKRSEADFTHSICPGCAKELYNFTPKDADSET